MIDDDPGIRDYLETLRWRGKAMKSLLRRPTAKTALKAELEKINAPGHR